MDINFFEHDIYRNIASDNNPAGALFSSGIYAEADIANRGTEPAQPGYLSTSCVRKAGVKPCH